MGVVSDPVSVVGGAPLLVPFPLLESLWDLHPHQFWVPGKLQNPSPRILQQVPEPGATGVR